MRLTRHACHLIRFTALTQMSWADPQRRWMDTPSRF